MAYIHVCDLCGRPLDHKNDYSEYRIKKRWCLGPDHGWERLDAHDSCIQAVLNARRQHVMGKTPGKLTNIEWLCGNPETLVNFLYCPYPGGCIHETELTLDNEDLCRPCMLDWLKEEHKDD